MMIDCPVDFTAFVYQSQEICIMADYYSIDGVRTPLTVNQARDIAEQNGWSIPDRDLVDAIWLAADCKLDPITLYPNRGMEEYELHNHLITEQLHHSDYEDCNIVAGHKKDVLEDGSIYGWHRADGTPIQPVFYGHKNNYADYSHGIRFIIEENP